MEAARLAALCEDPTLRQKFDDFWRRTEEPPASVSDFFAFDREFTRLMFAMSGNPVLELVSEIIYDFSQSFLPYGMFWRHRDRARAYAIDRKSTRLNSSPLMRISYAVFCLKKKTIDITTYSTQIKA